MRRRKRLTVFIALLGSLAVAVPAQAVTDPLFVLTPTPPPPPAIPTPPPTGYLYGPCGLAVDSSGRLYVSDYYHHAIDVFTGTVYSTQLADEDPQDGPCGLALDSTNHLYVNDYHRDVLKFGASPSFGAGTVFPLPAEDTALHLPTGVAVDTTTNRVYVDNRTWVSVYDSSGNPIEEGGEPLEIGKGTLGDGYGVAVSQYPATLGRLYVPDAATNTVKVYDPLLSTTTPVAELKDPFNHPFVSLRDSAIAVDKETGTVYFADDLQPEATERPQATIYAYNATNAYAGHLKYNVIDALPVGLAVDNTVVPPSTTQGRVYVTSGNTSPSSIYAYAPGSTTFAAPLPPIGSGLSAPGSSSGTGTSSSSGEAAGDSGGFAPAKAPPSASTSAVAQQKGLRVSLQGGLAPRKLPRKGTAPVSVSVGWDISTADGSAPPRLKTLKVEINRHGVLDYSGLPVCPYPKIQPASTKRALRNCRSSLVGRGNFKAEIALKGQEGESYETGGSLLVFNGEAKGKPVLYGQIYSAHPFATSFVIVFKIAEKHKGTYGTVLSAKLPKTLRTWGNLTGIEMKLKRTYGYQGRRHSFLAAGCPAPKGFRAASFTLARTSFAFNGGAKISSKAPGDCRAG